MPSIRLPRPWDLPERTATPEDVFLNRRQVVAGLGLGAAALALPSWGCASPAPQEKPAADTSSPLVPAAALGTRYADRFPAARNEAYTFGGRPLTPEETSSRYNNFYEFTTTKERVWELAQGFSVDPWKVEVAGLVKKPRTLDLDDILKRFPLEERLYRFRCVEAWAMQVPWTGYPLRTLIDYLEPLPKAKWVRFVSFLDPERLPGQKNASYYPWPYYEALRLDEARNEVAFVVVGSYGHALPMQHGAPWRLALPWKYGYKGPKSVVRIELSDKRPPTFWNDLQAREYGFFSNVNPERPHPRWSQATERDIGTGERRPTLLYNGYGEQVASLYTGKEV
jgi:sulfoxide reductase catalytic subunit YedY